MKIAFVIGTKAELIKCMPIMLELKQRNEDYFFVHTGQHTLGDMCERFKIKKPDFILSEESKKGSKLGSNKGASSWKWYLGMIFKIRKLIRKIKPDYVIYHGDTISTGSAAAGTCWILNPFKKWKGVHLEAGLRSGSFSEPFPEEIIRQFVDRVSDILLAVSDRSVKNLKKERWLFVWGEIYNPGNTVIDSATLQEGSIKNFKKIKEEYALINMHRHENLKSRDRLIRILQIVKSIGIKSIWPMHDNTKETFEKFGLMEELRKIEKLEIRPFCEDYSEFVFLEKNCKYLVVDGGSIQEESLLFKKPCILLRKSTERQEGLPTGINFLTKLRVNYAKKVIEAIEQDRLKIKNFENPYGKPGVSKRILEILK
jgi:UDP-N-acetylglucosamine 2-epimerase (non-hydrolysing)